MSRMGVLVLCLSTICLAQSASSTTEAPSLASTTSSKSTLESLEALGVSFLNSVLSPSTAATSTSPISSTSATSGTPSAQTVSPTTSDPTTSPTDSALTAAAIALADRSTRNTVIVLGSVLGVLLLLCLIFLILCICFSRRGKTWKRQKATPLDDDEIHSWRAPQEQRRAPYVPVAAEPRPVMEPATAYTGHQTHQPIVAQDPFADPVTGPGNDAPVDAPPEVVERNSIIERGNGLTSPRPTNWDLVAANNYHAFRNSGGYAPMPRQQFEEGRHSVNSMPERVPTPMFGAGREVGEVSPQRHSNGSTRNSAGQRVPRRSPRRPRSLTSSPLATHDERMPLRRDQFDFGFDSTPTRYSGGDGGVQVTDAHHRF